MWSHEGTPIATTITTPRDNTRVRYRLKVRGCEQASDGTVLPCQWGLVCRQRQQFGHGGQAETSGAKQSPHTRIRVKYLRNQGVRGVFGSLSRGVTRLYRAHTHRQ